MLEGISSCKIPDQYLKKQKTFRTLDTMAEKNEKKRKQDPKI